MAKSDLVVLQEMAEQDMDICSSTNLIELYEVPQGGIVTMGVDRNAYNNLMEGMVRNKTHYCIMYVVNKQQFDVLKKA